MISGLTRDSGRAEIVRAALESVALQTRDLANAFADDGVPLTALRVDGGMAANDWLMQTSPTSCASRWSGRSCWRRRRGAPRGSPGCRVASIPPLGTPGFRHLERTFTPTSDASASDRLYEGWMREVGRARG